jgi:hypothetical protein
MYAKFLSTGAALGNLPPDVSNASPYNTDDDLSSLFVAAVLPEAPATPAEDLRVPRQRNDLFARKDVLA